MNLASLSSPGPCVLHLVLELQDFLYFLQFAICDFRIWIEPRALSWLGYHGRCRRCCGCRRSKFWRRSGSNSSEPNQKYCYHNVIFYFILHVYIFIIRKRSKTWKRWTSMIFGWFITIDNIKNYSTNNLLMFNCCQQVLTFRKWSLYVSVWTSIFYIDIKNGIIVLKSWWRTFSLRIDLF